MHGVERVKLINLAHSFPVFCRLFQQAKNLVQLSHICTMFQKRNEDLNELIQEI